MSLAKRIAQNCKKAQYQVQKSAMILVETKSQRLNKRKSQMVDDTKSKKQHILDIKTENPNPKVAMSIKTEIPNCPMISLHSSYLGFTIIFLVVTDFCPNFIQLSVVFVSVSMFSHNNSYSQVKIIKCFYFELFIGNGIYREQPWGSGLSLRFKPKNRPAGMGCIDNLFQSECIPPPFKYI